MFFLRDPIERVQSCFHFERDVHKLYEKTMTMEDYVRRKLANPRISAAIGLQTSVLCDNRLLSDDRLKSELTREAVASAIANLHAAPAFGLVEHFAQSMHGFVGALQRYFPELAKATNFDDTHKNASRHGMTKSSEKLKYVRESLTAGTFMRLFYQTAPDRYLYEEARKLFFMRYADRALEPQHKHT
jgi:hypothetical protein